MYKQNASTITGELLNSVIRLSDNACIPFDPANTDYQKFKLDVAEGAELQDAEGNVMTAQAATDYAKSLP